MSQGLAANKFWTELMWNKLWCHISQNLMCGSTSLQQGTILFSCSVGSLSSQSSKTMISLSQEKAMQVVTYVCGQW